VLNDVHSPQLPSIFLGALVLGAAVTAVFEVVQTPHNSGQFLFTQPPRLAQYVLLYDAYLLQLARSAFAHAGNPDPTELVLSGTLFFTTDVCGEVEDEQKQPHISLQFRAIQPPREQ